MAGESAAGPEWAWLEWLEAPALRPVLRGKLRPHTAAARNSGGSLRPARRAPANLASPHGKSTPGLSRPGTAGAVAVNMVVNMDVRGPYRQVLRAELAAMGTSVAVEPWTDAASRSTSEIGRSVQSGMGVLPPRGS